MAEDLGITVKKEDNFSEWYTQVINKADLIEYSSVSGCIILKPYAYSMWEKITRFLDARFKSIGVQNVYFPLLIPERLLNKEAKHVEGFAPEVAWVTKGGNSELPEPLAIRPTSETIMYETYSKLIRSHRDLPLKYNQWCNVVRWEFKHPVPFLRTREFLWQEGHTAHANAESAAEEVSTILDFYDDTYKELMAINNLSGKKSDQEKFAGADYTLSLETLFPNGKAIQACTSHFLGQNFAKAFDISFLDENEKKQLPYQNSWGFSTRSIGVMIGIHGDNKGLVLPPNIAPIPVVVVPILFSKNPEGSKAALKEAKKLCDKNGWHLDDREGYNPGFKFHEWELKGVPIRIEIGPKDVEKKQAVVVRRDTGEKSFVSLSSLKKSVDKLLVDIQTSLLNNNLDYLNKNIVDVKSMDELKKVVTEGKIGRAFWVASKESEEAIKDATGAKSLNTSEKARGTCFLTGEKDCNLYTFGRSY